MTPSSTMLRVLPDRPTGLGSNRPQQFMCECPEPLDYYFPDRP